MKFDVNNLKWTREPEFYTITEEKIEIITKPHTDLWQRTYYHFRNDNAPVLQMSTDEKYFSFTVKTEFESKHRFDQCGVVMYLDSENWLKGSIEYENEEFQHLGSVVTNHGYSDWATTVIDASVKSMWYRFSRREDDYCIECSQDGVNFGQMRVCHMWNGGGTIQFGIYACSPENSSFKATFTNMELGECKWLAHDGQAPDEKFQIEEFHSFPEQAENIRRKVFIDEQGFEEEFDETDHIAVHFVVYDEEIPVGTCRVFWSDVTQTYVLGRLAVLKEYRGKRLGAALVERALAYVQEKGGKELRLHAQCRITAFYEAVGFEAFGEIEDDQGCPHIWMKKEV